MLRTTRFLVVLALGLCLAGCDAKQSRTQAGAQTPSRSDPVTTPRAPSPHDATANSPAPALGDTIKICSFNIQVFGTMSLGALKPATERRFKTSQLGSCLVM